MKKIKITEKLLELGFELKEDYHQGEAYVFRTSRGGNRFIHDFAYYPDENQFYINAYKSSTRTITEEELLKDHNNLNTSAKEKWLEIKNELKDFNFRVWN